MSIKSCISIVLLLLILSFLLTCEEKEPPTNQTPTATVYGYVSYSFSDNVELLANTIVSINDISDTTGINGYYQLDNVQFGEHTITCIHPEYDTYSATINIDANEFIKDVKMGISKIDIEGHISYRDVLAIDGVEVTIGDRIDTSDGNGYYEFSAIDTGFNFIKCAHPEYDTLTAVIYLYCDTIFDIEITKSKFAITGQVYHFIDGNIEGAQVQIDNYIDTTDSDGQYRFALVDIGSHAIECNHPEYFPYLDTIEIIDDSLIYDIGMSRPLDYYADTLWIEEDAAIIYSYIDTNQANINGGDWPYIGASVHYEFENWLPVNWEFERFFMNLPPLSIDTNMYVLDSAKLFLIPAYTYASWYCCANIRRVLEPWEEHTITWNSQPDVSDVQTSIIFPYYEPLIINVSDNYKNVFETPNGLRISYSWEEDFGFSEFGLFEYSSSEIGKEFGNPADRPHVIIYYSQ